MAKPTVEIYPEQNALFRAATERIASILAAKLQEKERATLVLTGGNTPRPAYELLSKPPFSERVDWNRVHFFRGDERCVPPDSPESNFGMAWSALISKVNAPPAHIHRIAGELEDAEKAASLYEAEIRSILPGDGVPSFDLVLLGMGEDGHTASLFPGTQWDEERLVVTNHVPQSGARRISMTPRLLNEAKAIILLTAGSNKAKALARAQGDPASDSPVSRIRPARGSLMWMVDRAAASQLI